RVLGERQRPEELRRREDSLRISHRIPEGVVRALQRLQVLRRLLAKVSRNQRCQRRALLCVWFRPGRAAAFLGQASGSRGIWANSIPDEVLTSPGGCKRSSFQCRRTPA